METGAWEKAPKRLGLTAEPEKAPKWLQSTGPWKVHPHVIIFCHTVLDCCEISLILQILQLYIFQCPVQRGMWSTIDDTVNDM